MTENAIRRTEDIQPEESTETEQPVFDSIMAVVKSIPEIKGGRQEAKLNIEQDQIADILKWGKFWGMFGETGIRGLSYKLEHKAMDWLKLPSGWPDMELVVAQNEQPEGFALEIVNIGADAGVAHRRSGFLIIAHPSGNAINVQTMYLPEDNPYREPGFDMQNPYWQKQHAFMEVVNRTGREFVDQLDQESALNKLKLAKSLIDHAIHSGKSIPLSKQPQASQI